MKTNNKILYLFTLVFCLAFVFVLPGAKALAYYYDTNNYGGQYSISPLMTSTLPQGYYGNSYYNGGYYSSNNYQYLNTGYPQYYTGNNYQTSYSSYPNGYLASGNYSYYDYGAPSVTCYADNPYVSSNQPVRWTARVTGGPVGYYFYNWKGTDNPTSLNLSSISVSYQLPGVKSMNLTVTDPSGRSSTAYCGSATVNQYYYPPYNYPY